MSIDLSKDWPECRLHVQSKLQDHDREFRDVKVDIAQVKKDVEANKINVAKLLVYAGLGAAIGMALFQSALKYGALG